MSPLAEYIYQRLIPIDIDLKYFDIELVSEADLIDLLEDYDFVERVRAEQASSAPIVAEED